jgi:hypothetical protein
VSVPLLFFLQGTQGAPAYVPPVIIPSAQWKLGFSINGASANARVAAKNVDITYNLGARGTLSCVAQDPEPSDYAAAYRPDVDQEIAVTLNGPTPAAIFAGFVQRTEERPGENEGGVGVFISLDAADHSLAADSLFISRAFGTPAVPISLIIGNPATVFTLDPHGLTSGATVRIDGAQRSDGSPFPNGDFVATVTGPGTFTIPLNVPPSSGGGTARGMTPLKTIVSALVADHLSAYGISLDPAMTQGPLLEQQTFSGSVLAALTQLQQVTGWPFRFLPTKVLQMFEAGAIVAPFTINNAKSVRVQRQAGTFANRIRLRYGTEGVQDKSDIFVGDGSNRVFPLSYKPASYAGGVAPGQVQDYAATIAAGGVAVWRHVGIYGVDTLFEWVYRSSDNALVQLANWDGVTNWPAPAPGNVYRFQYGAQFPQEYVAQDDASVASPRGPREKIFSAPGVFELAAAKQLAEAYLLRSMQPPPRTASISTSAGLAFPGTAVPLDMPARLLAENWLVTSVRISELEDADMLFDYQLQEGDKLQPGWIDFFKELTGGASIVTGGGGNVPGPIAPPVPTPLPIPPSAGAGSGGAVFLGGSGLEGRIAPAPTWMPASGGDGIGQGAIQAKIDTAKRGSTAGKVFARLRADDAGVTAQARLWRVEGGGAQVGISAVVTSTQWTSVEFDVTLTEGNYTYELHVFPGAANRAVYATGHVI